MNKCLFFLLFIVWIWRMDVWVCAYGCVCAWSCERIVVWVIHLFNFYFYYTIYSTNFYTDTLLDFVGLYLYCIVRKGITHTLSCIPKAKKKDYCRIAYSFSLSVRMRVCVWFLYVSFFLTLILYCYWIALVCTCILFYYCPMVM